MNIGDGNKLRSTLTSNDTEGQAAHDAGLASFVVTNRGQRGQVVSTNTLATTLEAVLGAIFLDSGDDLAVVKAAMTALGLTVPVQQ